MSPDDPESSLEIPVQPAMAIEELIDSQEERRGAWADPRRADQPAPPWPAENSVALRYLLWKARVSIELGMDPETVMTQLATHAWFEGGIENYDRGQRDARRPRSI